MAYPTSSLDVAYIYDTTQAACISGETYSVGRLTRMNDASGHTQYCYDRFGRLTRKVQTTNGIAFTVRYLWTAAGQLSGMVYPDGTEVDYTRNALGQITAVGVTRPGQAREVLLDQATYLPYGPVSGWTYGNGRTMVRSFDQDYRPTAILDASPGGLSLGFGYDPAGNLTKLGTAAGVTAPDITFDYDKLGRLTATKDGPTQVAIDAYAYDATGNRLSHTTAAGTSSYTYPGTNHHLTDVGGTARTYDDVGNTTAIGSGREFVYSDANRMSQVKNGGSVAMSYAYNGRGEQVRRHVGTGSTYSVYDEAGHWLGDYDSNGAQLQQALAMNSLPVGLLAGDDLYYVEPDHLGTARAVIQVTGVVAAWKWGMTGEVFGTTSPDQDADADGVPLGLDMRFPGQRYTVESGLHYNYFRDYDPSTGRYAQSDPLGQVAGVSTYSYVSSSPLAAFDPFGLLEWTFGSTFWAWGAYHGSLVSYPGAQPSPVYAGGLARVTLDWSITANCSCKNGVWTLDDYSVTFQPQVNAKAHNSYSPGEFAWIVLKEPEHVYDLNQWAQSAYGGAQTLENSYKQRTFGSEAACVSAAKQIMSEYLSPGAQQAFLHSHQIRDANGGHTYHGP